MLFPPNLSFPWTQEYGPSPPWLSQRGLSCIQRCPLRLTDWHTDRGWCKRQFCVKIVKESQFTWISRSSCPQAMTSLQSQLKLDLTRSRCGPHYVFCKSISSRECWLSFQIGGNVLNSRGKHTQELFANDEVSDDVTISVPEPRNKNDGWEDELGRSLNACFNRVLSHSFREM